MSFFDGLYVGVVIGLIVGPAITLFVLWLAER